MIIFHDSSWLSMTFTIFHDFPGLENGDFPRLSMTRGHPDIYTNEQWTPTINKLLLQILINYNSMKSQLDMKLQACQKLRHLVSVKLLG